MYLQKTYAKLSERVKVLEAELRTRPTNEMLTAQSEKLTALQDVTKMHESRLTALETTQRSGSGHGLGGGASGTSLSSSSHVVMYAGFAGACGHCVVPVGTRYTFK